MKKRQNPTDYVGSCRLAFLLKKELFQCPQISGFLFYLPSTTPNILITSIFDSTYTYTVPIRFGKHVTYALTFGSDTGSVNLVFID